jgi:acetate kinase
LAQMNGADAICFTGGIGENAAEVRARACEDLEWFGIKLDPKLNSQMIRGKEGIISTADSRIKVYVLPTNEELVIARDTVRVVLNAKLP